MALKLWLPRHRTKSLEDVLVDEEMWAEVRKLVMGVVNPILREAFMEGAELAANAMPRERKATRILRVAVQASGVGPPPEEGLASSRGAVVITDPTKVRVLATGQRPRRGERLMYHGTTDETTGLIEGSFLTPSRADAQTFARVSERLRVVNQLPTDLDAATTAADRVLADYQNEFWGRINQTQRNALRAAIRRASEQGLGLDAVIADIEPLFGVERAKMWAITETTNMIGEGARATYAAAGMSGWEWRTVGDARVDPICEGLAGEQFPISQRFQAAHTGCRCWPDPVL